MKIMRICPEPPYLRKFRKHYREKLRGRPYDEQMAFYRQENVLLPGGWAASMGQEGFEVFETVFGDSATSARWAIEHGRSDLISTTVMQQEVLKEMVRAFQPDVIFMYAGVFFRMPPDFRAALRRCCTKRVLLTGFWGDELPRQWNYTDYFRGIDFMFCSSSVYEQKFVLADIPAMTIGNCFDDSIAHKPAAGKTHEFVFSGTTGFGYYDHIGRYEKLISLMHATNLKIWANEPGLKIDSIKSFPTNLKISTADLLAKLPWGAVYAIRRLSPIKRLRVMATIVNSLQEAEAGASVIWPAAGYFSKVKPLRKLFPKRVKPLLINASDYYSLVEKSEIVLNLHRDEDADIGNIRCYEVTGLGSVLVTDRGKELAEFFEPDVDFVAFETVDECVEKVARLLQNPEEMRRIAMNGQAKTLARHTVQHRARSISDKLKELIDNPVSGLGRRLRMVEATYNLNHHPISYDISFFLQAAEIYRKQIYADSLQITIVWPEDIENVPGVSKEADAAVDAAARAFRINHICGQLADLVPSVGVRNIRVAPTADVARTQRSDVDVFRFPIERDHHTVYYRSVMTSPELMTGFSASKDAHRYVRRWLDPLRDDRKVVTVTLRQYHYDVERNSNIEAWADFLKRLDLSLYAPVIVPDTDHIEEFRHSALGHYPAFLPACFDVDLRLALYEQAHLNMFINNGPSVAATLDRDVNYLIFKIVTPSVPHCTEEFLKWSGFDIGKSPSYAGPYQKWVWDEDTADVIWSEFVKMTEAIQNGVPPFPAEVRASDLQ